MAEAAPSRRFFVVDGERDGDGADGQRATAREYGAARPLTGAAQIIDLKKRGSSLSMSRTQAWQEAAWGYYDQVGELKFAFNLISQIVSRAMIFAAVNEDSSEVPIEAKSFLKTIETGENAIEGRGKVAEACKIADEALRDLSKGGQAEILRLFALNLSVPGECYLLNDNGKWMVASISELIPGDPPTLKTTSNARSEGGSASGGKRLRKDAYVARVWRSHPRYSGDPDSSMLGVLDQVEKVVLFDQVARTVSRSRLGAGIVFIPAGLTPANGKSLEEAMLEVTVAPAEDESVAATVTPLLLTGPPELADKIKRIDLSREIDEFMSDLADTALDRILAGLDIPKNIVAGLSDTRYANALVIDDALYKAHIEPMLLMICDALTQAYLRPVLRRQGVDEAIIERLVVWYNPSQIVTRPDRSQAANEGYDNYLISGETWRRARGFSDLDAPDEKELLLRMALEKAQIPPDMSAALIEAISPEFFGKSRADAQGQAGVPPEVGELLRGGQPTAPTQAVESEATSTQSNGGEMPQGGVMPPRADNADRAAERSSGGTS